MTVKKKKLAPAEEIRRIKHWLVDQKINYLKIYRTTDGRFDLTVGLRRGPKICIVDKELAAWRDVKRQVERAMGGKKMKINACVISRWVKKKPSLKRSKL